MVAIHIPRPAEEWAPSPQQPGPRLVPPARPARHLPDRATRIRRRRLAALVALVVVVALTIVGARALTSLTSAGATGPEPVGPARTEARPAPVAGAEYVVRPGDTLWTIAAEIAPDDDPRAVVDALREANGGAELQVGQRLDLDVG